MSLDKIDAQGIGRNEYGPFTNAFVHCDGEENSPMNLCTVKPSSFFLLSNSSSYSNSSPQDTKSEPPPKQTDDLSFHSSSNISNINPGNTTLQLTDNSKLTPACSMQLYNFPAPYLYAPYFGIYLQDMQNRMNWNSATPDLHSKSSGLSYVPLNQLSAVSLPNIQQWDLAGQTKKPIEGRPGFISEITAHTRRETKAAKSIPHLHTTQWLLSSRSSPSTGSPNSKHSKSLASDVFQPIPPKEKSIRYRRLDGTSRYPATKNLAAPLRSRTSDHRSISSSPLSSPLLKQSSFWPRTEAFLQEMERLDSQPQKQPIREQMRLQKFYYPKFNHDKLAYANAKSTSPSSTATPNSSSSNFCGPPIGKAWNGEYVYMDFHHITRQPPEIPKAIPAPYSFNDGRGTLDRILDNPHSTTNVYIRGFHPNTTDAMMHQYGSRFGEIETAKSIVDHLTNSCKGYGFIKYYSFADAENCIRGFYSRGYEAKFAKLGHNARLKTLSSPENTNLYVSNLPRKMNDSELAELFQYLDPDFEVLSQKILRDSQGVSRGVGFARSAAWTDYFDQVHTLTPDHRFKSPQICEKVIKCFHGKKISNGTDFTILQLRYADTNQQKMLKMETNHRRVFKANEYNTVVYGTGSNYFESPLSSISMSPLRSYPPSQPPSLSPNNHSLYSSPQVPVDGNKPNLSNYFRNMIRNPVPSPVEQNRASWMRMQKPEPTKNFSINVGRKFPNRSAPIGHYDDVFSH